MANSASGKSHRRSDEILAGEYVLGVVTDAQQLLLDERMRKDPQFAAVVQRWRKNLQQGAVDDQMKVQAVYDCIYGPQTIWPNTKPGLALRLSEALFALWRSISVWRTATVLLILYLTTTMIHETGLSLFRL